MKRTMVLLVTLVLSLTSCLALNGTHMDRLFDTDEQVANQRLESILDALKRQDKVALKSMFSATALAEASNFDDHVDYLFEFFQGDVLSWEKRGGPFMFGSKENGRYTEKELSTWYQVNTDKRQYLFIFIDCLIDAENPDNVGLYTLRVIHEEDEYTEFGGKWDDIEIPGIYKPTKTTDNGNL